MSHKYRLLQAILEIAELDMQEFGTGCIGIPMAARYYAGEPWTGVSDLLDHVPLSRSQLRRRLQELTQKGKLRATRTESGRELFMIDPAWADRVLETVQSRVSLQNETPIDTPV